MSGSRLVRGRGGRLAIYGGCGVVLILLVLLYRAATSEMAKLRELHEQCAHQQEALAAQLQVIYEYKVRLEKSLAEEKSSNIAVKQELQQRASREKSLRDKDTVEAMQRFNSLQQTYKLLRTENNDLKEECDKRQKQALEESKRLEGTLQDLRGQLRQAHEDKEKSLEHLKTRYFLLDSEKTKVEEKYNDLMKNNGDRDSTVLHLKLMINQLQHELDDVKKSKATSPSLSAVNVRSSQQARPNLEQSGSQNAINLQPPPSQQQNSSTPASKMQPAKTESSEKTFSVNPATEATDGINPFPPKPPVKLPAGVLPIPKLIDSKLEAEEKPAENNNKEDDAQNSEAKDEMPELDNKDKLKIVDDGNLDAPPQAVARHIGEQLLGRQENWAWNNKVKPGVQEVGDEPNHMEKLPGLDDVAVRQVGGVGEYGQYDGGDVDYDDKEPPLKNNDIQIEGEDEAEDEDDQVDYENNNGKPEKHPE